MGKHKLTGQEKLLEEANKRATHKIISRYYDEYLEELTINIKRLGGENLIPDSPSN